RGIVHRMKKSFVAGRRGFLKTVALAAGGALPPAAPQTPAGSQNPAGAQNAEPASQPAAGAHASFAYPRTFAGRHLSMIAFPLGGVAAGSISLGGRGQLRDWEIFNRPDKGNSVSYAFPSIWAQVGNAKPVARVLEAKLMPPYATDRGLSPNQVSGLTRLDEATFPGEYPLARIAFRDRELPVAVSLEAFTPFIPLDADASGLPVAVLRYSVRNPSKQAARV